MKHELFQSRYASNLAIVEERRGKLRLYPHTEQLPVIARSVKLELAGILPNRLAATDQRADPYRKVQLETVLSLYCLQQNRSRRDVTLETWFTPELVTRIGVVQEIITEESAGNHHRFRMFHETDFVPDVYFSGKQIAFTTHALERFQARASECLIHRSVEVMRTLFTVPALVMRADGSPACVVPYGESFLAFPFEESATEFLFLTCLTPKQINRLEQMLPTRVLDPHYGPTYTPPANRMWDVDYQQQLHHNCWLDRRVEEPAEPAPTTIADGWKVWRLALRFLDKTMVEFGRGPGTSLEFRDGVYGPGFTYHKETPDDDDSEPPRLRSEGSLPPADKPGT